MQLLHGTVQHYPWGTTDAIPNLLGRRPDGQPHAEYWLGAHRLAPSQLADGSLDVILRENPEILGASSLAGFGLQLPYLMKVLSARHALSLQAHPSRSQAEEGYARENAAGISPHSPERTYKDDWPKPEVMIALEDFETLSGFRDARVTAELFAALGVAEELAPVIGPLTERKGSAALAEVFLDVLSLEGERARLVEVVCAAARRHQDDPGPVGDFARTAVELDRVFPGDPGILAALLMNRVTLRPGEALYVPAGQMHAHLKGTGIEVMANSDNVIRGGLTRKHIDVGELVRVVDFSAGDPRLTLPVHVGSGVDHYPTPCEEFDVWRVTLDPVTGAAPLPGRDAARIVLVVDGTLTLTMPGDSLTLSKGEAAFIAAADTDVSVEGDGTAFVTSSGLR